MIFIFLEIYSSLGTYSSLLTFSIFKKWQDLAHLKNYERRRTSEFWLTVCSCWQPHGGGSGGGGGGGGDGITRTTAHTSMCIVTHVRSMLLRARVYISASRICRNVSCRLEAEPERTWRDVARQGAERSDAARPCPWA